MNRKISAFTAFMIIFSAILMHYFGLLAQSNQMNISYADKEKCCVYLTFDDGPSDRVTPKILDIMKEEGVKATFFIVGKSAERRKYLIARAYDEGHTIGVHSYSHDYKNIYASPAALLRDIEKCNDLIEEITGARSFIYRFPGGSYGISGKLVNAVTQAGYRYVDWNASVRDAELPGASPKTLLNAAKSTSADKKNIVLLCHDSTDKLSTASALKDIISFYKENGYEFCRF